MPEHLQNLRISHAPTPLLHYLHFVPINFPYTFRILKSSAFYSRILSCLLTHWGWEEKKMAEEVSGILGEEGEDQLEGEAAREGVVEKSPPDLVVDQSPGVGAGGGTEQPGAVAGNVTRLDSYSPAESGSRKPARTLVVTPASTNQGEEPSSGRRVSFKPDDPVLRAGDGELPAGLENHDLKVPPGRYTPSISPSPTSAPPSLPFPARSQQRRHVWRRRESEWVFRPLKLKFKVKELEELYKNYVYRQQQSLVCMACLIMMFLSVLVFIFFFANSKV